MSDDEKGAAEKAQKAPDAFRTISEVSTELDVPQHVLRFWESKFPVVKPLKRGGGRRYYRPADVELVRGIRDLLYTHGFTIKGAQKLLKEQGNKIENIEVLQKGSAPGVPANGTAAPAPTPVEAPANDGASLTELAPAASLVTGLDEGVALSPAARAELETILDELRALRRMLPK